METEELKIEFNKRIFKEELIQKLGKTCANCGSTDKIEYHHIVPLVLGGTNNLSNIVPLCKVCHLKAHDKKVV